MKVNVKKLSQRPTWDREERSAPSIHDCSTPRCPRPLGGSSDSLDARGGGGQNQERVAQFGRWERDLTAGCQRETSGQGIIIISQYRAPVSSGLPPVTKTPLSDNDPPEVTLTSSALL